MRHPTVTYRCLYCQDVHLHIVDKGPTRQLWCGTCACRRPFTRQDERITARTWPPEEREVAP